jgi:predicted hydrolase (HD superfamily)
MITDERRDGLDMELAEARALVKDKTDKDITVRHLISVEGVMRALAR